MTFFTRILGDPNEREIKRIRPLVTQINGLEDEMRAMSDEELRGLTAEFKQELENGAELDDLLPQAFAAVREASRRAIGMRHFDVQLIGGVVLHQGKIAEMRTGEGKTLVATLPSYLNALTGKGVHIVTVNDYLAKRDRDWMGRIHEFLGLSVGVILTTQNPQGPERRAAYAADITYGTNNEYGFDYLRDNMVPDLSLCAQRDLNFAIVDEVDNILIDEARTPLIISGQAEESAEIYVKFAKAVPRLREDDDYTVDIKGKSALITEPGIDKIERMLGIHNIYENMELTRHLENALKAHALFHRDKEYLVRDTGKGGEVMIVDEFTGRVLEGRRYSEGLHQAIEAKEGVPIQRENRTLATITFQNYFRLYRKLAGMTGTALTEAEEFHKIYKLDVVAIPTNKPVVREDATDFIYKNEEGKFHAVAEAIKDCQERGQPVLVGTTSVETSEYLSNLLNRQGVEHNVLNAKQHQREATIVAQAGRSGAVTIATNMAGRGTDIVLGGSPDGSVEQILRERDIEPEFATEEDRAEALEEAQRRCDTDREVVVAAGGLHIIGTERHESRRIDNQLRGRSGRQGDPGSTRFYVSLKDELMRRFGTDRVAGLMDRLGMEDDVPIENTLATKMIEQAQTKVEGYNFDIRKNVVEYDDVIAAQREVVYRDRRAALEHQDMHGRMGELIEAEVRRVADGFMAGNLPENWDLDGMTKHFEAWGIAIPEELFPENINQLRRKPFMDDLVEIALDAYEAKISLLKEKADEYELPGGGAEVARQFERVITQDVVDRLWMDHIDAMDVMRSGIHLRSVAQKDPLVEFKREAFQAFEELKRTMHQEIVDRLYRMQLTIQIQQPAPQQPPRQLRTNVDDIAKVSGQAKGAGGAAARQRALPAASGRGQQGRNGQHAKTGQPPAPQPRAKTPLEAAVERASQAPADNGADNGAGNGAGKGSAEPVAASAPAPSNAAKPAAQPVEVAAAVSAPRPGAPAKPAPTGQPKGIPQGHPNGQRPQPQRPAGQRPNSQRPDQVRPSAHGGNGQPSGSGARPNQPARMQQPATDANTKPGRNDPCYCGSGKKYKMCHGK